MGFRGASKIQFLKRLCSQRAISAKPLVSLIKDEEGQAVTEYILILAITMFGAAALARALLAVFDQGILHLGSELEKSLKTGRAPKSVWSN